MRSAPPITSTGYRRRHGRPPHNKGLPPAEAAFLPLVRDPARARRGRAGRALGAERPEPASRPCGDDPSRKKEWTLCSDLTARLEMWVFMAQPARQITLLFGAAVSIAAYLGYRLMKDSQRQTRRRHSGLQQVLTEHL